MLTAGGDAPGMNAAIRAVVRAAHAGGIEVVGVRRGFEGLIDASFELLPSRAVANIVQHGGTILETSRSKRFRTLSGRKRAADNLLAHGVESLVTIGGDGTLAAACAFQANRRVNVVFVPATIDNDVPGTDYSIGFDTAVNTALGAIDRIRDTAFASERLFFVEVMGRDSGFIATAVAIGGGAEAVIVPEAPLAIEELCRRIMESHQRGKRSSIIVVSEGPRTGGAMAIAGKVAARTGMEARVTVLGHFQRGGAPTARDRVAASRMGAAAVEALARRRPPTLIGEERGEVVCLPLEEAAQRRRRLDPSLVELVYRLSV